MPIIWLPPFWWLCLLDLFWFFWPEIQLSFFWSLTTVIFRAKPQKRGNSLCVLVAYTRFFQNLPTNDQSPEPSISSFLYFIQSRWLLFMGGPVCQVLSLIPEENSHLFYYDKLFALSPKADLGSRHDVATESMKLMNWIKYFLRKIFPFFSG